MAMDNRICLKMPRRLILRVGSMLLALLVVLAFSTGCESEKDPTIQGATQNRASSGDLYCLEFTSYSGPFVEDGTNEQVENILAMLLENRSDEYLDFATITYDVGGETAEFTISGLPPGESTWVLEANRMPARGDAEFELLDCQSSFRNDAVLTTEDLEVVTEQNSLTVKNISDKTLNNVCVYYKNFNSDGNYLGGITYMIAFDTLSPDEELEKASAHFSENSRIVRYSYQTE